VLKVRISPFFVGLMPAAIDILQLEIRVAVSSLAPVLI
jgi:hypothetical protein